MMQKKYLQDVRPKISQRKHEKMGKKASSQRFEGVRICGQNFTLFRVECEELFCKTNIKVNFKRY